MQDASMKLISVKCHNLEMCILNGLKKSNHVKVRSFFEHSCAILSSFKIVIIFNITSAEIKTKSAVAAEDVWVFFERTEDRVTVF